jgi:hypothetical protein
LTRELPKDIEIVSVEMDRVRNTTSILNGEEVEFVGLAEIDDVFTKGAVAWSREIFNVIVENVFDGWVIPFDIQFRTIEPC